MSARKLTWAAMFVALTLVADQLPGPPVGQFGNMLRFVGFPVVLSGLVLGSAGGFLVGAVSDILGFLITPPHGPYFPGFTLTQALTGALPPLFFRWLQPVRREGLRLALAILLAKLLCSVWLVSTFLAFLSGKKTFWFFAGPALVVALVHSPLYAWLSLPLMRSLRRLDSGRG